tara:strand:- start:1401 stop:1727 length:327 start_codon:yes stop_codon:yes gene_type:complete
MASDITEELIIGDNYSTFHRLQLLTVGAGFTQGAAPKGIYIDADLAETGVYTGVFKDVYGNQFTLKCGNVPASDPSTNTLFMPIQISEYVSETSDGGRFSDVKAYAVY